MEAYYELRAEEYDDWYLGRGRFADRDRPGFRAEVEDVAAVLSSLPPARTLDVGCGTGFVTRQLRGVVVGADRSAGMLRVARSRVTGPLVFADALRLPFRNRSFGRVFAGHVYGHLAGDRAEAFLREAWRVAPELVLLDSAIRADVKAEEIQERVLNDGSTHLVYKRFFDPDDLVVELGSASVLFRGRWFVVVRATGRSA
jgi:demethylmenaquinone methyltransferase/2-methoxy-6-polyprenyl-1,4-benzoquinol methylase